MSAANVNPAASSDANPHTALKLLSDNGLALAMLVILNFLLPRWLPGDPMDALLGDDLIAGHSDAYLAELKAQLGLDISLWQQFVTYVHALLQGDLGYSMFHAAPVTDVLAASAPWTLLLLLSSIPLSLLLGTIPGLLAGAHPNSRFDHLSNLVAAILSSIPSFALAMLLLSLFAAHLGWFPLSGASSLFAPTGGGAILLDIIWHAALPVFALALHSSLRYFYLARGMACTLRPRPFIAAARSRGIGGWRLLFNYYGSNTLSALLAKLSSTVPMIMGATLFVEIVFAYPGIGYLMFEAIQARDYPLIQGGLFCLSLIVLTLNSMLDICVAILGQRG